MFDIIFLLKCTNIFHIIHCGDRNATNNETYPSATRGTGLYCVQDNVVICICMISPGGMPHLKDFLCMKWRNYMSNWFLKCAAAGIVVISYADTIAGIVQYEHIGSFLWILSIVIIIIAIASHKNKERIKKIQVIDLASTIYVIMRANEKYHFKLEFQPAQNYMNVYSIRFAGIVQSVVYNLVAVFAVAIVLNAVLSSYGWGLTRLVKTAYYRIFYSTLYCLLRNKLCYALFRKYAIGKKILSEAAGKSF